MKNGFYKVLTLILAGAIANSAFAMGDSRLRIKMNLKVMSPDKKVAIVAFAGNSIVTGNAGIGSLVTGLTAKKKDGENKMTLDNAYMGSIYDMFVNTLSNEGYNFIPAETIVKARSYQEATAISMPSFIDAKGLKQMNVSKPETLQSLSAETGADLFFHVTSGHSMGMRSNIGVIVGKHVGISNVIVEVYDATGKKLGYFDASEISEKAATMVAGGFSDPNMVMPLLEDADRRMISKLAARISLKK